MKEGIPRALPPGWYRCDCNTFLEIRRWILVLPWGESQMKPMCNFLQPNCNRKVYVYVE